MGASLPSPAATAVLVAVSPWAWLKPEAAIAVLARNEEKNQRVMSELQALGVPALAVKVDVSARGELQSALKKVEETLGPVSILVNNAGISVVAGVLDQTPEDWDKVIETNLNACFLLSKLAAQSMVNQRQGKIINIASMYSFFGSGFVPSYSANGLHAFPSHPVARLAWGKRNELLQRLEFFETVFLLLHHRDKPCPTQRLRKASASSVQRLLLWRVVFSKGDFYTNLVGTLPRRNARQNL
jgi:hypothetical protein